MRTERPINNNAYVNLMVDNFPQWKDYPKRINSIIVANDSTVAHNYGENLYRVIPYDNIKNFGVAPQSDFWSSFSFNVKVFNNFLFMILHILESLTNNEETYVISNIISAYNITYEKLVGYLEDIYKNKDKIIPKMRDLSFEEKKMAKVIFDKNNMKKNADEFNPDKNKFGLLTYEKAVSSPFNEIWFEGEAILIKISNNNKYDLVKTIRGKLKTL